MSINQKDEYMSVINPGIQVEPGYHTIIKLVPTIISSTNNFKGLPQSTRECKYSDENDNEESLYK